MIFFTSDEHYGGEFIRNYYDRPFPTPWDMDNEMIVRHNRAVGPDDTCIHVGDFWHEDGGSWENYRAKLNGRVHILQGNHSIKYREHIHAMVVDVPFLDERNENSTIYDGRAYITHEPANADLNYRINIVGHMHDKWKVIRKEGSWIVNVSVEQWEYKPVSFDDIKAAISKMELHIKVKGGQHG